MQLWLTSRSAIDATMPRFSTTMAALGCLVSLLATFARPQSYDLGVDLSLLIRRQDGNSPIVVTPLPLVANGTVPVRTEIRLMKADPYKWNLLILAMSLFQGMNQDDPLSWYQVAGQCHASLW